MLFLGVFRMGSELGARGVQLDEIPHVRVMLMFDLGALDPLRPLLCPPRLLSLLPARVLHEIRVKELFMGLHLKVYSSLDSSCCLSCFSFYLTLFLWALFLITRTIILIARSVFELTQSKTSATPRPLPIKAIGVGREGS